MCACVGVCTCVIVFVLAYKLRDAHTTRHKITLEERQCAQVCVLARTHSRRQRHTRARIRKRSTDTGLGTHKLIHREKKALTHMRTHGVLACVNACACVCA